MDSRVSFERLTRLGVCMLAPELDSTHVLRICWLSVVVQLSAC